MLQGFRERNGAIVIANQDGQDGRIAFRETEARVRVACEVAKPSAPFGLGLNHIQTRIDRGRDGWWRRCREDERHAG